MRCGVNPQFRSCPRNCKRRANASIDHWAMAREGDASAKDPRARRPAVRRLQPQGRAGCPGAKRWPASAGLGTSLSPTLHPGGRRECRMRVCRAKTGPISISACPAGAKAPRRSPKARPGRSPSVRGRRSAVGRDGRGRAGRGRAHALLRQLRAGLLGGHRRARQMVLPHGQARARACRRSPHLRGRLSPRLAPAWCCRRDVPPPCNTPSSPASPLISMPSISPRCGSPP